MSPRKGAGDGDWADSLVSLPTICKVALDQGQCCLVVDILGCPPRRQSKVIYNAETLPVMGAKKAWLQAATTGPISVGQKGPGYTQQPPACLRAPQRQSLSSNRPKHLSAPLLSACTSPNTAQLPFRVLGPHVDTRSQRRCRSDPAHAPRVCFEQGSHPSVAPGEASRQHLTR